MAIKHAIYAFENLDGVCAAAILLRWMRVKNNDCRLDLLNYSEVEDQFNTLAGYKANAIFILDFPPEQIDKLQKKLLKIQQNGSKIIYWNSHLKVAEKTHELLKQHLKIPDFDTEKCSAIMVWQKFMPRDQISKELASIAFDREFWANKDERSAKLADILSSGYNKKELIDELSRGVFWSDKLEKSREEYLIKKDNAFKDLTTNLVTHYNGKYNFGFGFSSSILSTADAGSKVLEDKGIDVSVIIYRSGKISFRRNDEVDLNLLDLAIKFNGGGHEYAAGGMISEVTLPINSHDKFNIVVEKIDKILREHFKQNEEI
jgi:uncharacterized protein